MPGIQFSSVGIRTFVITTLVFLTACGGSNKGGYYKDDGPPRNPPSNLDSVVDATPRVEPLARGPNRPYTIMGKRYVPDTSGQPYLKRGMASWYGRKFHGNPTANGERYDMFAMTAAHTTLPIPSYVRVTRVSNAQSVIVRVNDRGPFLHSRVIDLSYAAAQRLGMVQAGSAEVVVERIMPEQIQAGTWRSGRTNVTSSSAPKPTSASNAANHNGPMYVQIGAFRDQANAQSLATHAARQIPVNVAVEVATGPDKVYRVRVGPFNSREAAERQVYPIGQALGVSPSLSAP